MEIIANVSMETGALFKEMGAMLLDKTGLDCEMLIHQFLTLIPQGYFAMKERLWNLKYVTSSKQSSC
jgi:hypothetical protein